MASETQVNDEALLASMGYKQELKRDFSALELFGLAFTMLGIVPSLSSVLVYAIPNGGPVAMIWGWAVASFFLLFIAMAMAELGSSMPTSGGLYYWTYQFSSLKYRKLLSWIVGYTNSIAYIAGVSGVDWGCAVQIMAAASISTDGNFVPTVYQTYGVYCALLVCHCLVASIATKSLARIQGVLLSLNIFLWLGLIIAIPVATPKEFKNSRSFAFGDFENFYGWPNGFAFVLSFLTPCWTISGFDAGVHISEEARNAKVAVPWTIMGSVSVGIVLGWILNIVLVLNMGPDLLAVLGSPIGQPMATILFNSFGKTGTLVVWSFVIISQFAIGISILTVSSRQNFAFARDGALPFSSFLYRLNARTGTPVNCVWAAGFVAALLGLLSFAGAAAIGAVFTLGVVGQYTANSIPISARLLGGSDFKPGPFSLGAFSKPVAVVAVAWMAFMAIVLLFPTAPQTDAADMNYTVVVLGGVLVLSVLYYYFPKYGGVHWFNGPVATIASANVEYVKDDKEGSSIPDSDVKLSQEKLSQ